jgi:alanine racemase
MEAYTLGKIAEIVSGEIVGNKTLVITKISTDSRRISEAGQTMFMAIAGERHDGHKYIGEMYRNGIRSFLISNKLAIPDGLDDAGFVVVKNTIEGFQKLAAWHRSQFKIPVIAITGSNGKTIVKEWLSACLASKYKITRSPKSYNSQLGVPLSVWMLDQQTEMGIFEAGISLPGEMENLEKIIQPEHGIITNIGEAHQENFQNLEEKVIEKLKLFKNCTNIYYCSDQEIIRKAILNSSELKTKNLHSWSVKDKNAAMLVEINRTDNNRSSFTIQFNSKSGKIDIPFSDKASIENSLQVIHFLLCQQFSFEEITQLIPRLQPIAMRLEQVRGMNNCKLINDAYNSDLHSLGIALDFLVQQPLQNKCLVLSDIQQSGIPEKELYLEVGRLVKQARLTRFIGIGQSLIKSAADFEFLESHFFETTQQFLESELLNSFTDEAILIKGARVFQFERIVSTLSEKNHTTILEINLNNLLFNLNYFRSLLTPGTGIMVMVKALAYGSGSHEIATLLQHEKVDYLGVAFTDEGIQLRQSGINLPIMVMSPGREDFRRIIEYELEPEIYSFAILKSFIDTAVAMQISNYPIHLKIDTGMHRLGFMESNIDEVLQILKSTPTIKVKAVFSHLAGSDDKNHDEFTRQQIACFQRVYGKISQILGIKPIRHILNSAGIERFPEAHFELVRLGIGLHGLSAKEKNLLPVSTLKTHISQIKNIPAGDTIGYNRRGKAGNDFRMAIIPIGYADGLNRKFGNGNGQVIINDREAPFIGDICMDMCMVDVSHIDCSEGDEVIVFGEHNPITRLAKQIGTIPYEILTNVSGRVKRVYFKD